MIPLSQEKIEEALETAPFHLQKDLGKLIRRGEYKPAAAALMKKNIIKFPKHILKKELDLMVERSMITIEVWESMSNRLNTDPKGQFALTQFLKHQRRIQII